MERRSPAVLTWLVIVAAAAAGTTAGCNREVLVAGGGAPHDAGEPPPPAAGDAGEDSGTVQPSPACTGRLFAGPGLPGTGLMDQAADAVTGDWNGDGRLDLAIVHSSLNAISVVAGRGDGTFWPAIEYATGAGPVKIATGDLNGDRRPDLVVANAGASSATILLGRGDGTFGGRTDLPTGPMPQAVAIGDFTADGKPDVVAGDTLFVGRGDGTFARGTTYGYAPSALATADVNRDGRLDLVLAQVSPVFVLLARGDGTFTTKPVQPLGWDYPMALLLRDLNGDGKLDLAVQTACQGEGTAHFFTFLGAGDGTFGSEREYDSQDTGFCDQQVAAADIDGDGNVDLQIGATQTWFGQGDGTFRTPTASSLAPADALLSLADWTRDGRLDLAVLDPASVLKVLPGHGDGMFGLLPLNAFEPPPWFGDAMLADATGDGEPDLLAVTDGAILIRRGNGDGTFAAPREYPRSRPPGTPVQVGDLNGDGRPDLVTLTGGPTVSVALGEGDGQLGPTSDYALADYPLTAAVGDVDGDGRPDLLVVNDDFVVATLLGDGSGLFGVPVDTATGLPQGTRVGIGDLDGDGRLDVAALTNDTPPVLKLFLGTSSGTLVENDDLPAADTQAPILVTDLDRDGKPDLVTGARSGRAVRIWMGTGAGLFGSPTDVPLPSRTPIAPLLRLAPPADVDGDGTLDLIAQTDRLVILPGKGDGTFWCADEYALDFLADDDFFTADLNHDGRADVVVPAGGVTAVLISH